MGAVDAALATFRQLAAAGSGSASAAVIAQLATAAMHHDPAAASSLQNHLAPVPEMDADAAAALETTGAHPETHLSQSVSALMPIITERLGRVGGSTRMSKAAKASGSGEAQKAKKRSRKKVVRLPKGFDPENPAPPPDPERWLPKWQRSDFKRKRRSRKDKVRAVSTAPNILPGSRQNSIEVCAFLDIYLSRL